ncbi:MAG: glycosyltransferase family 2 protein [Methanomassiliicoccales archaeon]|nr:glycosyltransferase family 2 protein [Methanomassiliicoccales archaeon]
MREHAVAAIIPAYNEELTIGSVVLKARNYVGDVYVVDDGSSDETARVAEAAGARVFRHPNNGGKAKAVLSAFSQIKTMGYDAVVMLDADGQHEPDEIPIVLGPVLDGSADMVIGSRFMNGSDGIPRYRKAGQVVLNAATDFGAKVHVTDSQSGFRALGRDAVDNMNFMSSGYTLESDMINHLAERGMRITEVPIPPKYAAPNNHKKNSMTHGMGVLNGVVGFVGYRRPLLFFGVPGVAMVVAGLIVGFMAIEGYFIWGWLFQSMLATVFVIIGTILMIAGLTLNSLVALMKSSRVEL